MRYGIVGSRHFADLERVETFVAGLPAGSGVVTGGASGVDAAATRAARARGLPVTVVAPSFEESRDPGVAGARNQRLVDQCEVVVAFWDGGSGGTRMTLERALDAGKEIHVFVAGRP